MLGINPYGSGYSKPVGTDGKLLPGAKALWNDDWRDILQRMASRNQVDLDISGGSEKSNYFFSLGYLDDKGMAIESGFKRYNTRLKINSEVKKWLNVGANLSYTNSIQQAPTSSDSKSNVIQAARVVPSFIRIMKEMQMVPMYWMLKETEFSTLENTDLLVRFRIRTWQQHYRWIKMKTRKITFQEKVLWNLRSS
jgi:hypothetical protein